MFRALCSGHNRVFFVEHVSRTQRAVPRNFDVVEHRLSHTAYGVFSRNIEWGEPTAGSVVEPSRVGFQCIPNHA